MTSNQAERAEGGGDGEVVPPASRTRGQRWHALDTLRAAAMASVLISHGSLAYLRYPLPGLPWLVRDPAEGLLFDGLFQWTRVAVPLFFALSGFFAALIFEAKGPTGFLIDRTRRILVPLLVGFVTVLPLSLWVWAYGWFRSGRCSDRMFLRLVFSDPELRANKLGTGHLWFLSYALAYLSLYWLYRRVTAARAANRREEGPPRWARALLSPPAPLLLTFPTALILWLSHEPDGLDAMLNRHNAFFPEPFRFLNFGVFFAFGVALHRARAQLERLRPWAWMFFAASLLTFLGRFFLLIDELSGNPATGARVLASALLGGLTCWLSVYGLLGLAQRYATRESAATRYLADASYWVYWSHMPVLGLLEVHLLPLPWPAVVKFAVVVLATGTWTLASYHVLIRHTAIGRWLHGPRPRVWLAARPAGVSVHPGGVGDPPRPVGLDRTTNRASSRPEAR